MGHHWREKPEPAPKPSVLWEFLGLLLGAFRPGDSEDYLPFDPAPRSFKKKDETGLAPR